MARTLLPLSELWAGPVAGVWVDMPYKVGDVISCQDFGRNYEINMNRDRKYRPELPKFYTIRFADIEGRVGHISTDTTRKQHDREIAFA